MNIPALMKEDASCLDYEEWYEKYQYELQVIYHEEGANHDADYEEWCEEKYNSLKR